jgi:Ca-activated chloride channel family protein
MRFLLLSLLAIAGDGQLKLPPAAADQAFRISVDVNLVVLNTTVRDAKGGFVSDLNESNFEVYEDGVRQSIRLFRHEDVPVTVGLVIDHSSSMRPKLSEVAAAARTFAQSSSAEDQMFVVNFNERASLGLPAAVPFTNLPEELAGAVSRMPADGQTALYDAALLALDRLTAGRRDKKVLVVISDGGDNASAHNLVEVLKMAEQSSAMIYTVGIFDDEDPDRNPGVLKRLAQVTGGEALFPRKLNDVVAVCERIARDIRNQYTLGYVSSNVERPGVFRSLHVVARTGAKKLLVRSRSGYIAGTK